MDDKKYLTKTHMAEIYALSAKWIERLDPPDLVRQSPHYKKAAPMKLYLADRVEAYLKDNEVEYAHWIEKRAKLFASARKVADKRCQETLSWAMDAKIWLDNFPGDLQTAAEIYFEDGPQGDRGIVAMLRHNYTNYEELIGLLKGKTGRYEAYSVIRNRVIKRICTATGIQFESEEKWASGPPDRWAVELWGLIRGSPLSSIFFK